MPRPVVFVCLAALALLAAVPATAAADGFPVEELRGSTMVQMTFNEPTAPGANDPTINDYLTTIIKFAPADADIKVAIFTLSKNTFKQALIDQANDGQGTVKVVFDGTNMGTDATELKTALDSASNGWFVRCQQEPKTSLMGACLGHKSFSRQHAKYALISKTIRVAPNGGTDWKVIPYVTWIGSANPSGGGGSDAWNAATTVYNDPTLYNDMTSRMFNHQFGLAFGGDDFFSQTYNRGYVHSSGSNVTVWASPELEGDHWLARLNDITPTDNNNCTVRVMQGIFAEHSEDRDRGVSLANKLANLKGGGCAVHVLVAKGDSGNPQIGTEAKQILCDAGVSLRARKGIHDKGLLVNAKYLGEFKKVVFTGSHNFTQEALTNNDELIVRIGGGTQDAIYVRANSHFSRAWDLTDNYTGQPCQSG